MRKGLQNLIRKVRWNCQTLPTLVGYVRVCQVEVGEGVEEGKPHRNRLYNEMSELTCRQA